MKIVQVKVSDLIFAEYNPRQLSEKQGKDLMDSIKRFGFVDPIIVNSNPERMNVICGGHQRVRMAQILDIEKIPVHYIDLTPDKEKELNIRLNRPYGEWDWDMLANEFDEVDLIEWGFDEKEFGGQFTADDFEEPEPSDQMKIILEYSVDDYSKVIDAFGKLTGTKEQALFELLGLK